MNTARERAATDSAGAVFPAAGPRARGRSRVDCVLARVAQVAEDRGFLSVGDCSACADRCEAR
eukprot:2120066-Lingulodinium_polyedra.AAC.1